MIVKPTPEVVQALTNLRPSNDFQTVLEFLSAQREKARDETESTVEGPALWRAQGRSIFLRDFAALVAKAPNTLERFKSK